MKIMICQTHLRFLKGTFHHSMSVFQRTLPAFCLVYHKYLHTDFSAASCQQHAHSYCMKETKITPPTCHAYRTQSTVTFSSTSVSFSSFGNENKMSSSDNPNTAVSDCLKQYLRDQESGNFGVQDVKIFVSSLETAAYTQLSRLPWLHADNTAIAFMQLVMNNLVESSFSPIQNNEAFRHFYKFMQDNLDKIPSEDYPPVLLSLIYIGVDHTDSLIHSLFNRVSDMCHELSIHNLVTMTQVLRTFRTRSIPIIEKLTARFFTLLDEKRDCEKMDSEFLQDSLTAHIHLNYYISKSGSDSIAKTLLDAFERSDLRSDSDLITTFIRYRHRMMWSVSAKLLDSVSAHILAHIQEMAEAVPQKHIGLYCQYLRQMNRYKGDLAAVFQNRCLELLNSDKLQVRDLVALVPAFDKMSSNETKHRLISIMSKHIDNADVLILSSLAEFMMKSNIYNQELMVKVQAKTLDVFDSMCEFISRFTKIINLLSTRLNDNDEFHSVFFEKLLKLVEVQQGVRIYVVSLIAQYILPNVKQAIPQCLMDRLFVVIPQCDLPAIKNILSGLNHMKRPWDRQLHHQVLELRTALQRSMIRQIENVVSLERLIQQINIFYLKNSRKDSQLLERMMQEMHRLTKALTLTEFSDVVQLLNSMVYYAPEVFENITDFIVENKDEVSFQDLANFISAISQTRYCPSRLDELSQCCHDKLETSFEDKDSDIVAEMQYVYHLCCLQICPDSILTHVFTVDYLEKVDKLFEAKPEVRDFLEDLFFRLNRCVVLEYPHLDIPWFHEDYCSTVKPTPMLRSSTKLLMQVEDALKDVLGGSAYFESSVFTPYHHFIHFECLLDSDGRPMPYPQTSSLLSPEGRLITFTQTTSLSAQQIQNQRVAVVVLFEKDFCLNSRQVKGDTILRRRHLEIMGYKVVEIPHYIWNSMALADWTGKTSYLRDAILGSLQHSEFNQQKKMT